MRAVSASGGSSSTERDLDTHLKLRKVRFVTYKPGDRIPAESLVHYAREAADLAAAR